MGCCHNGDKDSRRFMGDSHENLPDFLWRWYISILDRTLIVMWSKKHWHKKYFEIINKGSIDKDNVSDWEYKWAGLSFPDGYHPRRIFVGGRLDYKP